MSNTVIKLCKDCKYYKPSRMFEYCTHKKAILKTDLVNGTVLYADPGYMRALIFFGCGRKAKLFEPKESN